MIAGRFYLTGDTTNLYPFIQGWEGVHLTLPPHIFRPSKVTEHVISRVNGGEFRIKRKKPYPNPNP